MPAPPARHRRPRGRRRSRSRRRPPRATSTSMCRSAGSAATTATSSRWRWGGRAGRGPWSREQVGVRFGDEAARHARRLRRRSLAEWERERRRLRRASASRRSTSAAARRRLLGPERLERLLEPFRPLLTPPPRSRSRPIRRTWTRPMRAGRPWRVAVGTRRPDACSRSDGPCIAVCASRSARRASTGGGAPPSGAAPPPIPPPRTAACATPASATSGVDLIFGIPGQTAADLDDDIAAVLDLRPDHVSWYELDVVEGTALAERLRRAAAPESAVGPAAPAAGGGDGGSARPSAGLSPLLPGRLSRPCPATTSGRRCTGASCVRSRAPATRGTR